MTDSKNRVLIIDDDSDFCMMLSLVFDDKDFDVTTAQSLEEARAQLSGTTPGIVLLDNRLPDGKGIDFIETIFDVDPRICIFMISGEFNFAERQRALQLGVTEFIEKPCSFKEISDAVKSVC